MSTASGAWHRGDERHRRLLQRRAHCADAAPERAAAIDSFVARMALLAHEQSDAGRVAFWRAVSRLAGCGEPVRMTAAAAAGSD